MAREIANHLRESLRDRRLVRITLRFQETWRAGYVVDVGPKFFVLASVDDGNWLDGFRCFRINDVRSLKPDPYASFVEAALKKRREKIPKKPRVNIDGIGELLVSAGRAFPLVAVHRERKVPGACWIGRVLSAERGRLSLLEINPDASWDEEPTEYRLNEITRVDFGGDYEDALHLVGGDPPTLKTNGLRRRS